MRMETIQHCHVEYASPCPLVLRDAVTNELLAILPAHPVRTSIGILLCGARRPTQVELVSSEQHPFWVYHLSLCCGHGRTAEDPEYA